MMIASLRLQNFRSYVDESFEFDDGVNIIVGPNASGKTNLLEALLVVCLGSSYRARDGELVRFEAPWARLDARLSGHSRTVKLVQTAVEASAAKELIIDDRAYKRLSLSKILPVVLFEPQHLSLLSGAPELRRTFIDDLLEQSVTDFAGVRRQYKRALTQRNALLKRPDSAARQQLFAWNISLSELGGRIFSERQRLLDIFNQRLSDVYSGIAHQHADVQLVYTSSCPLEHYSSHLLRKLEAHEALDLQRGFTAYGPHRDDIAVYLGGHRAVLGASRGEIRSLLLSLKILELQLLEECRGRPPLLLLDDVFSELDGSRRRALTQFLRPYQTFITTTDADIVVQHFINNCRIIPTVNNAADG